MRVIKPIGITDAILTSSTIAEPDTGETTWSAGTYTLGTRRIKTDTHRVYEVVADPSTADDPDAPNEGINADPATWVDVSATNKWAMFDLVNSTQSLEDTQLIVEVDTGIVTNSVAGINITGASDINVTMTDPVDGIVYDTDIDMVDNSDVADWYYYFFSPIVNRTEFALVDLPAYADATIKVTIDGDSGEIGVGNLIFGNFLELGVANYGSSLQLLDFSKKETDSFGNTVVIPGRTSKLVDFDVTIPRDKVRLCI